MTSDAPRRPGASTTTSRPAGDRVAVGGSLDDGGVQRVADRLGPTDTQAPSDRLRPERRLVTGGFLLGVGIGGFVDGIVLHQLLQWHHMGTGPNGNASLPGASAAVLEEQSRWDGLFHTGTWIVSVVALYLVWSASRAGHRSTWRTLTGLLLIGWGVFDVVEGLVNHQLLGIHHVRDDLGGPLSWDLGFLAFGVVLVILGELFRRSDHRSSHASIAH